MERKCLNISARECRYGYK